MNSKINIYKCLIVARDNQYSYICKATGRGTNNSVLSYNNILYKSLSSKEQRDKTAMFMLHNNDVQVDLNGYAIFPLELLTEDQKDAISKYNKEVVKSFNPVDIPFPNYILECK